jgi:hypothetical protein
MPEAIYENLNYKVEQYDPPVVLEAGSTMATTLNYAVVNKKTGATEHNCEALPQAISVALQFSAMLEVIKNNPDAVVDVPQISPAQLN